MRVAEIAVGLVLGIGLGFALHEWLAPGVLPADGATRPLVMHTAGDASAPNVVVAAAPPRASTPLDPVAVDPRDVTTGSTRIAAADALVGILVHGAIVDTDGKPVPGGERNWLSFDNGLAQSMSVPTNETSTYAMSGLRPGELSVSANPVGYRPYRRQLTLTADQPVVRLDIVLEPAVVLLVKGFTPTGEPLVDAVVKGLGGGDPWRSPRLSAIATREAPAGDLPEISFRAYTRWGIGNYSDRLDGQWNGTTDLPSDVMGRLELDESLPAYVSLVLRHVLVATQRVEPGATEVVFTVPIERLRSMLGSVRVRVVDAQTGMVPEGASASLSDSQSSGGEDEPDADGVFVWERQRPGQLELSISAPDHETWDQIVSVPPGGTMDLGTIELSPTTSVSGFVVDTAGAPVAVSLKALRDDLAVGLGMGSRRYSQSDAEGRFTIKDLGRHRYSLVVSTDKWTAVPVFVDARNGNVDGARVVVEAGATLRVRPHWPMGQTWDVDITRSDGVVVTSVNSWTGEWPLMKRLPAGSYVVTLRKGAAPVKQVPVTLAGEDVVTDIAP